MKLSVRKMGIWAIVAIAVAIVLIPPVTERQQFEYRVDTVSKVCTFDEYQQQSIESDKDSITIVMPIEASNPCHDVLGTVAQNGKRLVVNLETKKSSEFCAECIGIVVGKVVISNLDAGEYEIEINSPDKSIRATKAVG